MRPTNLLAVVTLAVAACGSRHFDDGHHVGQVQAALTGIVGFGGGTSVANDLDEEGRVVGAFETVDGATHAFLFEDGTLRDLSDGLGEYADDSEAVAINENGTRTITGCRSWPDCRAFLWKEERRYRPRSRALGQPKRRR